MTMLDQIGFDSYNAEAIRYYGSHPVDFAENICHITLDPWQKETQIALERDHFVAIRSGSGVGKTTILSLDTCWFLCTKPYAKVPSTAPSQHQLYDILWSEHFKWINRSEILMAMLDWTQTRVGLKGHEPEWYAVARTAKVSPDGTVAEGLQGFHSEDNILFVVDEASGVPEAVFPAIEGSLTNENSYALLAGNPTRRRGYFYEIFNAPGMKDLYTLFHISCLDSPRVSKRYIDMMKNRYGVDHPIYQIKVLGNFPTSEQSILILPDFLEKMQLNKKDSVYDSYPIIIGIDAGRVHAASVAAIRQGKTVLGFDECPRPGLVSDTADVISWASELINEFDPLSVYVDAVGIGAGVYDGLKSLYGKRIIAYVGGSSAIDKLQYVNLRAEVYWKMRDDIPNLYCARWPERFIAEAGDIRTKNTRTGKMLLLSKEEMRAMGLRSPDYADALSQTYTEELEDFVEPQIDFHVAYTELNRMMQRTPKFNFDMKEEGSRWANA